MGFRSGVWAKIWEITPNERSTKVRVSTSKKNKDGKYDQDFSGYVTLAGTAHKEAGDLKVGDTFKIGDCEVTSRYDKEKKKEYINFAVYSFGDSDQKTAGSTDKKSAEAAHATPANAEPSEDSEDLPF